MSRVFTLPRAIVLISIIVFGIAFCAWWRNVYSQPEKVFDRMLKNSLTLSSAAKHTFQSDGEQTLKHDIQFIMSPRHAVHSISDLRQEGQASTNVVTENFSTPDENFVRYNRITTSQKNAKNEDFDFSKVVGLWAEGSTQGSSSPAQIYSEGIIVPLANLNPENRKQLLDLINQEGVYEVDYSSLKRTIVNHRPVYSYGVTVKPVPYIKMLKTFTGFFGVTELDSVNADDYAAVPPLKFEFEVDVWSSQLTKVTYVDSGMTEYFGSFGAKNLFVNPKSTILIEELQTRLQQIQ